MSSRAFVGDSASGSRLRAPDAAFFGEIALRVSIDESLFNRVTTRGRYRLFEQALVDILKYIIAICWHETYRDARH
jgi:hypothetical protein